MTEPGLFSRIAGYPPVALLLFIGCGFIFVEYYEGNARIIPLALAIALTIATLGAVARMSRYRRWKTAWDGMAELDGAPARKSRLGTYLSGIILIGVIPFVLHYIPNHPRITDGLALIWIALCALACIFVLVKVSRGGFSLVRGSVNRSRYRSDAKAYAAPVSWMLGRAASAPSRRSAARQLPDYTLQLMSGKGEKPRLDRVR